MDVATTLLVVVDLQRGFVTDDTRPVLPVVGGLMQRWTAAGGAVLLTQFVNRPGSAYERLVHWAEMQGPPQTDIVPQLAGYLGHPRVAVLEKNIYTLLSEEGAAAVQSGGWTDLVFCGIDTDSCVLKSAVDAFEAGYTPWIVRDACASTGGRRAHEAGLLLSGRFIGVDQLIDSDTLLLTPITS